MVKYARQRPPHPSPPTNIAATPANNTKPDTGISTRFTKKPPGESSPKNASVAGVLTNIDAKPSATAPIKPRPVASTPCCQARQSAFGNTAHGRHPSNHFSCNGTPCNNKAATIP